MLSMNDRRHLGKSLNQNNWIKYIETLRIEFKLQLPNMLDEQKNSCNLNIYCKVIQEFTTYKKKSKISQLV
jgi:predicted component of type VI protein secretion system